jgi:hypothetical protein
MGQESGERFRREALEDSAGADVFDSRGRRLGLFIGVVSDDQVAIRHDGAFLWRRRVLPLRVVARVVPTPERRRAVVLNVQREAVGRLSATQAVSEARAPDEEEVEGTLDARLAPYVGTRESNEPEQATSSMTADEPHEEGSGHLLFVGSPEGYRLVEKDGRVPSVLESVSLPDYDSDLRVIKVGASPLPDDERMCAYLQQT